jgi:hypothetical protein
MKTQAWAWLTAAVLAAGLNATYHDGGMDWAHRIADRVEHNTSAVLALATGHADQFVSEARWLTPRAKSTACPLTAAFAQTEVKTFVSDRDVARFEAFTDRESAELDRLAANRDRIEAQIARVRIPAVAFTPVVVRAPKVTVCPRVRVNLSRLPQVRIPAMPLVRVDAPGLGPI